MINRPQPVQPGKGLPLGVGDRHDGDVAEFLIQRHQIGDIETPMQRRQMGYGLSTRQGKVQIVDVGVDDVEATGLSENQLQHQDMVCQSVQATLV
jgi:hypothetical protein